jgi:PAS domain S-box-containing protein
MLERDDPVRHARSWPASLLNGSEMGRRIGEFDWSTTPIGAIEGWSQSLRAYVGMIVDNPFPMYIFWGERNVALYNDRYITIMGDKHPAMFGRLSDELWSEIWHVVDPLVRRVRAGEAVTQVDLRLPIHRYGFEEDGYFTFSYSPLRDDDGEIAGVLATVFETTANVLAQRRIETLRDLALRASVALTQAQALRTLGEALAGNADVPFASIYLRDGDDSRAQLVARIGTHADDASVPSEIDLAAPDEAEPQSIVVPIAGPDRQEFIGALVAGVNPRLRIDDDYRKFIALLAAQIGNSVVAARAFEDERVRAESEQITRTIQKIGLFAESGQQLFWVTDETGAVTWYNQSWYDYTGQTPEEALGSGWMAVHHPDDVDEVARRFTASVATCTPFEMTFRLRGRDGRLRWFLTRAVPDMLETGRAARWYGTSTNVDSERRAVEQLDFLAGLGDRLVQTLDRRSALVALIEGLVPDFADWAMINLADSDGELVLTAAGHRDPECSLLLESFVGSCYEQPYGRSGSVRVFSAGRTEVVESTTPQAVRVNLKPAFADAVERIGLTSAIIVPIISNGKLVGTFHALSSTNERTYAEGDVPFYEEIGRRIGFALQNASAYEREVRIARAFQNAALPSALPDVPGVRFASLYEPSSSDANIGGDFYDAFRLLDGRVVVSIGDVSGSGLGAAATMAALRQSIRAAASINPDPDLVLKAADGVFADPGRAPFASAFVAVIDPLTFSMQYANAGHPPPMLRAADGTVTTLESGDLLLGVTDAERYESRRVGKRIIEPGTLLVLYTDGLTEATRDLAGGERRLIDAISARTVDASNVHHAAREIHDAVLIGSTSSRDDIALLCASFDRCNLDTPEARLRHWTFASDDGAAAHAARNELVAELERCGLRPDDLFAAEMIFSELVGNVLRHASTDLTVVVDLSQDSPVLHVIDFGEGFSLNPKLPADSYAERGRGLYIVMQLAREFISSPRTFGRGSHARAVLPGRVRRSLPLRR